MSDKVNKINEIIKNIKNKEYTIYFFVYDTNGNQIDDISNIYKQAKHLQEIGYSTKILTEKQDQKNAGSFIGKEYNDIEHVKAEGVILNPEDVLIIPELCASIMESAKKFPCKKIIIAQNYNFALDVLELGVKWDYDYNFEDVIVTNSNMEDFVKNHFINVETHVIPVVVDPIYNPKDVMKKPVILIGGGSQDEIKRIVKSFILQSPMYSWVTFKHVSSMLPDEQQFEMNESAALVWVDKKTSFGTLPLEAMACGLPVIGLVPDMIPEWLTQENGIWVNTILDLPMAIEQFLNSWVEFQDDVNVLGDQEDVSKKYNKNEQIKALGEMFVNVDGKRIEKFEKMLENEK